MPHFQIHRMKEQGRESFRWAAHLSAQATVKAKDYEPGGEIEARHEYEAWLQLRESDQPLCLGDLLETETGELRICKYVGFEPAQWFMPQIQEQAPEEIEVK